MGAFSLIVVINLLNRSDAMNLSLKFVRNFSLKGVFPPIVTPFTSGQKQEICYKKAAFNMDKWKQHGVSGYVTLGSAGEYVCLREEEAVSYVKFVAEKAHGQNLPLIAGAGCESTDATIKRCELFANVGADALMIVTPH